MGFLTAPRNRLVDLLANGYGLRPVPANTFHVRRVADPVDGAETVHQGLDRLVELRWDDARFGYGDDPLAANSREPAPLRIAVTVRVGYFTGLAPTAASTPDAGQQPYTSSQEAAEVRALDDERAVLRAVLHLPNWDGLSPNTFDCVLAAPGSFLRPDATRIVRVIPLVLGVLWDPAVDYGIDAAP